MPPVRIQRILFAPPIAIARLGGSDQPMEAYTWAEDPRMFGAGQTVIQPTVSLEVLPDGSIEPYLPGHLRLKDGGLIRPVCPFLELHADYGDSKVRPLTLSALQASGLSLDALSFCVNAANRKAARRTNDESCAFEATLSDIQGSDHTRHELLAWSRSDPVHGLVSRQRPIHLGWFQVIRPLPGSRMSVDLGVIRVRFTPAQGKVYGPKTAIESIDGVGSTRRRLEIVPDANRILNGQTNWTGYNWSLALKNGGYPPPDPAQSYDGETDLSRPGVHKDDSWGVVDDTCDAVVDVRLRGYSRKLTAQARVIVGPTDFAPDRRPLYSLADDLADRDPQSVPSLAKGAGVSPEQLHAGVVDLFRRVLEVTSLTNVDRSRDRAIQWNAKIPGVGKRNTRGFPPVTESSLTKGDATLSQVGKNYMSLRPQRKPEREGVPLYRAALAEFQHEQLADPEYLLWFLVNFRERFLQILRPAYHWLDELKTQPQPHSAESLRDPRYPRDLAFDMRMPPYIRDADSGALSLNRRQWNLVERWLEELAETQGGDLPEWSKARQGTARFARRRARGPA